VRGCEQSIATSHTQPEHRTVRNDHETGRRCFALSALLREDVPKPLRNATATLDTMAEEDEPEPDGLTPDESETGTDGGRRWSEKIRSSFSAQRFFRPGSPTTTRSDEARAAVNFLDQRERRIAITATIFELALTLIVVVPYLTHSNNKSTSDLKTLGAVHVFLFEGIVLFAFLLIGTVLRRRALFGFASLLVGFWLLQIKALSILGIAYVGLGMWLVLKGLRSPRAQGQNAARKPATQPRSRGSRKSEKEIASRAAPKPNKRYTPPKPPRRSVPKKPVPAKVETPKH